MSGLASMRHVALPWAGLAQVYATPVRPIHTEKRRSPAPPTTTASWTLRWTVESMTRRQILEILLTPRTKGVHHRCRARGQI